MMHLTVTGTVKNAPQAARRHVLSLRDQSHEDFTHRLFCLDPSTFHHATDVANAGVYGERRDHYMHYVQDDRPVFANLLPVWRELPDEEPIVWLDGDDWLAVPEALAIVSQAHEDGAWVTYGSFICSNGGAGFSGPSSRNARREPWRASHLKTFRAALVKAMRDDDFRDADGTYAGLCTDLRVMFACLEMCPPGRARFVPNILQCYNMPHSFAQNARTEERAHERAEETRIRAMVPYTPLVKLWLPR